MARPVTKIAGMTPLQALVTETMRTKGKTPKDVEDLGVAHATLHRYMKPVVLRTLPRRSVLESLANGLGLEFEDVRDAAIASLTGRSAEPWRASMELATAGLLQVAVIVDRIDRLPITPEDIAAGWELAASALVPTNPEPTPEQEQAEADDDLLDKLGPERESDRNGPEGDNSDLS